MLVRQLDRVGKHERAESPGREPDEPESEPVSDTGDERASGNHLPPVAGGGDKLPSDQTGETDAYSRAYSAPESEHVTGGPYVPADLRLYDYDDYEESSDPGRRTGRSALAVGGRCRRHNCRRCARGFGVVARHATTYQQTRHRRHYVLCTARAGRNHDHQAGAATAATSPTAHHRDPDSDGDTDGHCDAATTAPPATTTAPPPATTTTAAAPPPTTTTPTGPRQVTYSVTGTKAPGDIISVTYVDAAGRRRTQHNVYIPWSMTVTPISQSDVGSVEASSLFRVSKLNCSITTSDGTVLSSNSNDGPQTSC